MSANDFKIVKHPGYTRVYKTQDRDTSLRSATIKAGEFVKIFEAGSNFVSLLLSGEPTAINTEVVGITRSISTETATADGEVGVSLIYPMETVVRGKAQDSSNMNTTAELAALLYDWVTLEVAASIGTATTINENEGSDRDVHGLCIVTGNIIDGTLDIIVSARVTQAAPTSTGA